jgi:hypothetical protein
VVDRPAQFEKQSLSTGPIGKEQATVTNADEVAFSLPTAPARRTARKFTQGFAGVICVKAVIARPTALELSKEALSNDQSKSHSQFA